MKQILQFDRTKALEDWTKMEQNLKLWTISLEMNDWKWELHQYFLNGDILSDVLDRCGIECFYAALRIIENGAIYTFCFQVISYWLKKMVKRKCLQWQHFSLTAYSEHYIWFENYCFQVDMLHFLGISQWTYS